MISCRSCLHLFSVAHTYQIQQVDNNAKYICLCLPTRKKAIQLTLDFCLITSRHFVRQWICPSLAQTTTAAVAIILFALINRRKSIWPQSTDCYISTIYTQSKTALSLDFRYGLSLQVCKGEKACDGEGTRKTFTCYAQRRCTKTPPSGAPTSQARSVPRDDVFTKDFSQTTPDKELLVHVLGHSDQDL